MTTTVKYLIGDKGHKTAVLVPMKEWEAMQQKQQQLVQKLAVFNSIRAGLTEVREAKKGGKKLQILKDFLES